MFLSDIKLGLEMMLLR